MALERVTLVGGEPLNAHVEDECMGPYCTIHNNSDHHMVKWKQTWDGRVGRIMRICPHNVAHPDPDEINPNTEHHCDTCCDPASQFQLDAIELNKEYVKPDYLTPTSLGVSLSGTGVGPAVPPPEEWIVSPATGATSGGTHLHSTTSSSSAIEDLNRLIDGLMTRHRGVDL